MSADRGRFDPPPAGAPRCSQCSHHIEVYQPQPGVSQDRCRAAPRDEDGDLVSCYRNVKNDCPDFRCSVISSLLPTPKWKWWAGYM